MEKLVKLSQEELRQLQLTELEMLVEVDRICKKNNIQYSLDGGTLLGAIRHKGFIPWDDDVDVVFTRHEYAKFCRACKKDLDKKRFFFQEYRTDPYYRWEFAKLRRKDTEFVRENQGHMKYTTGVNIDIFVVDNFPDNPVARWLFYWVNIFLRKILYSEVGKYAAPYAWLRAWYRLINLIPRDVVFRIRNIRAARQNRKQTKLVSHYLYPYPSKMSRFGIPAECFNEYVDIEFEGMSFKGLKQYDKYLTLLYGDYMTLPPEDKRYTDHTATKIVLNNITIEEIRKRYQEENAGLE